jgi:hypothetical protein
MPLESVLPPPQYDFPPKMPVIERVLTHNDLQWACGQVSPGSLSLLPGQYYGGCSALWRVKDGVMTCFVWRRPDDDRTRRHELAHCNGWPKEHPK